MLSYRPPGPSPSPHLTRCLGGSFPPPKLKSQCTTWLSFFLAPRVSTVETRLARLAIEEYYPRESVAHTIVRLARHTNPLPHYPTENRLREAWWRDSGRAGKKLAHLASTLQTSGGKMHESERLLKDQRIASGADVCWAGAHELME